MRLQDRRESTQGGLILEGEDLGLSPSSRIKHTHTHTHLGLMCITVKVILGAPTDLWQGCLLSLPVQGN